MTAPVFVVDSLECVAAGQCFDAQAIWIFAFGICRVIRLNVKEPAISGHRGKGDVASPAAYLNPLLNPVCLVNEACDAVGKAHYAYCGQILFSDIVGNARVDLHGIARKKAHHVKGVRADV